MPSLTAIGEFGGQPIINATSALESAGLDHARFSGKANSFICPIGEEPGRGWLLMHRSRLEKLDTSAFHKLRFGLGENVVEFPSIIITGAERVSHGGSQDPKAVYLVEIADKRWLARQSTANNRYNLREPNSASYAAATLNTGSTPWTWQEIAENLWGENNAAVLGAWDAAFWPAITTTSTPENIRYDGMTAWAALNDFVRRVGCQVLYDPINDLFRIVQMGSGVPDSLNTFSQHRLEGGIGLVDERRKITGSKTPRRDGDGLTFDRESIAGNWNYPEKVTVFFPTNHAENNFDTISGNTGRYYPVEVAGSSLGLAALYSWPSGAPKYFAGTRKAIYDPLHALFAEAADPLPSNDVQLTARATEIAKDFYRTLLDDVYSTTIYAWPLEVIPGPWITKVSWFDIGAGLRTSIHRDWPEVGAKDAEWVHSQGGSVLIRTRLDLGETLADGGTAQCTIQTTSDSGATWSDGDTITVREWIGLDEDVTNRSQKNRIIITGAPTGGDFTVTVAGQTTTAIARNASAATVVAAVEALSSVGSGNVTGSGGSLPNVPVDLLFGGDLDATTLAVSVTGSLTGGTSPAVSVSTVQTALRRVIIVSDQGGWYGAVVGRCLR